jgi:hypothetical protein
MRQEHVTVGSEPGGSGKADVKPYLNLNLRALNQQWPEPCVVLDDGHPHRVNSERRELRYEGLSGNRARPEWPDSHARPAEKGLSPQAARTCGVAVRSLTTESLNRAHALLRPARPIGKANGAECTAGGWGRVCCTTPSASSIIINIY